MITKGKVLYIDGNKFIIQDIMYNNTYYLDKVYVLLSETNKKEWVFGETELIPYIKEDRKRKISGLI